jgi:hypothetical protein
VELRKNLDAPRPETLVEAALNSIEGFMTVDEIILSINLNGRSRTQEDRRAIIRSLISKLRHSGVKIETQRVLGQRTRNGGNTAYRKIQD